MAYMIHNWMPDYGLKGNSLLLYAVLYQKTGQGTYPCMCTLSSLMRLSGLSKPGILNIVRELSDRGLIRKTVCHGEEGMRTYYEVIRGEHKNDLQHGK